MLLFSISLLLFLIIGVVQFFINNSNIKKWSLLITSFLSAIMLSIPALKAIRSLDGAYLNLSIFKLFNLTFVIDNIAAPVLLFLAISFFLILLNFVDYVKEKKSRFILFLILFIVSIFALLTCINAIWFILYNILLLSSFMIMANCTKRFIILSNLAFIPFIGAFTWLYFQFNTIDFAKLLGNIDLFGFLLIIMGIASLFGVIKKVVENSEDIFIKVLALGGMVPLLFYIFVRFLFLWRIPEEFTSYLILVFGFCIAFYSMKRNVNDEYSIINLSYKNIGLIFISLAIAMFGMILKNLPVTSISMYAVYFFIFNQIIAIPALLIAYKNMSENDSCGEFFLYRFLPDNSICFKFLLFGILALPPLTGFVGGILLYNSFIAGFEIKNYIFMILLLISMVLLIVLEVFNLFAVSFFLKKVEFSGKSLKKFLGLIFYFIILLFVGLFPNIAVEFFVAPVFVFSSGNLFVPQVLLSNISVINLSFVAMFFAVFLLRFLLIKENK